MLPQSHTFYGKRKLTQFISQDIPTDYFNMPIAIQCRKSRRLWSVYENIPAKEASDVLVNGKPIQDTWLSIRSKNPFSGEPQYSRVLLSDLLSEDSEFYILGPREEG